MNTDIVDYLVQSNILTTDENSSLLDKSRAEKCDFILRRLIRDSKCLKKLEILLHEEPKVDEFDCFRSLLCNTSPEPEILNSDKQGISSPPATPRRPPSPSSSSSSILNKVYLIGNFLSNYFSVFPKKINKKWSKVVDFLKISENDSAVFFHNLKLDENRRSLLNLFRRHINSKISNSILDDFLQEDLITVEEHEEISSQSERCRTRAAELLLDAVERSHSLKILSILKSYDAKSLANLIQLQVEETKFDFDKSGLFLFLHNITNYLLWP